MGIGDVTSTEKGTAARYNAGKPDYSLIPLRIIADSLRREDPKWTAEQRSAIWSLCALGSWQEDGDVKHLYTVLTNLKLEGWPECAFVLEYGRAKYAAWNWAKGFAWSVPFACAARHLMHIIGGEHADLESKHPHRGHVFANVVMLLTFHDTFPEGDDRPRMLAPVR
jgi:hypothetical protein